MNIGYIKDNSAKLPLILGHTVQNELKVLDLAEAPNILIAGAVGQGKTHALKTMIESMATKKSPSELRLVLIDPKGIEFSKYSHQGHNVIFDPSIAVKELRSLCEEMEHRYELKNNAKNEQSPMPYIVIVIDEYADLLPDGILNPVIRLAQKGRAAGIHIILSTQRLTHSVISGIIKANFPVRIAFRVASAADSKLILDRPGAEQLTGKGKMLCSNGGDAELITVPSIGKDYSLNDINNSVSESVINPANLLELAAKLVVSTGECSFSVLQRRLGIGFRLAGDIMEQLEKIGVVGVADIKGYRPVLVGCSELSNLEYKISEGLQSFR